MDKSRIKDAFQKTRQEGRAALIPYVTAGYPTLGMLAPLVRALEAGGADLIEIGIPFSDPLADGPILQEAATRALAGGVRVQQILDVVSGIETSVPLLFLTYVNLVYRRGIEQFIRDSHEAGISGLIIPDWPWVESAQHQAWAHDHDVALIPFAAPTSTDPHLDAIAHGHGFVYTVSVTGVTGARTTVDKGLAPLVTRIKEHVSLPVAVGFGISTPEQARETGQIADGVIVGSALVKALMEDPDHAPAVAERFVKGLRDAL